MVLYALSHSAQVCSRNRTPGIARRCFENDSAVEQCFVAQKLEVYFRLPGRSMKDPRCVPYITVVTPPRLRTG